MASIPRRTPERWSRILLAAGLVLTTTSGIAVIACSMLAMMRALEDIKLRSESFPSRTAVSTNLLGAIVAIGKPGVVLGFVMTVIAVIRLIREAHRAQARRPLSTTPPPSP